MAHQKGLSRLYGSNLDSNLRYDIIIIYTHIKGKQLMPKSAQKSGNRYEQKKLQKPWHRDLASS